MLTLFRQSKLSNFAGLSQEVNFSQESGGKADPYRVNWE
jgi:hypothetical protein